MKTLSLKNLSFQTFKCLLIKWNVTIISIIVLSEYHSIYAKNHKT